MNIKFWLFYISWKSKSKIFKKAKLYENFYLGAPASIFISGLSIPAEIPKVGFLTLISPPNWPCALGIFAEVSKSAEGPFNESLASGLASIPAPIPNPPLPLGKFASISPFPEIPNLKY